MNPADITNALIYGIPLVTVIGYGYEALISSRGRSQSPLPLQKENLRRAVSDAASRTGDYQAMIAETPEQLDEARNLVRRRYMWRGYQCSAQSSPRARFNASPPPEETTLIVKSGDATVGTMTLRLDGPSGLLAESTHPDSVREIRNNGGKVCELTQLAIAESTDTRTVLAKLLSIGHLITRKLYSVSDILIEVNPRHVDFYCRVLGFDVAAEQRVCQRVGAPSVLLRLELEALERRFRHMGMGFWLAPLLAEAA